MFPGPRRGGNPLTVFVFMLSMYFAWCSHFWTASSSKRQAALYVCIMSVSVLYEVDEVCLFFDYLLSFITKI